MQKYEQVGSRMHPRESSDTDAVWCLAADVYKLQTELENRTKRADLNSEMAEEFSGDADKLEEKNIALIDQLDDKNKEIEKLKFLVTNARHDLFKKKLITFDEVASWQ